MIRRPPRSTRTDTLFPYTTLFRSVLLRDGRIAEVNPGATAVPAAEDLGGDTLLPGLIDLHTDHFEKHVLPRPGTRWDMVSAVMAHDAQMAAGGITTSFDCVCVGVSIKHPERREIFRPMIDAVREASTKGMLRARSEERRVGKECVRRGRSRWSPDQ